MAPGDDTAKALLEKEEIMSNSELGAPAKQLSPSKQTIYEDVKRPRSGEVEDVDEIDSKHVRYCSNDFPALIDKSPLDFVIAIRTSSRTLSITGRESMIKRFRQRRSVDRDALVDSILEGLGRDEVKAVYNENKPRKEFERSRIDQSRTIWKRQAHWLAIAPEPFLIPESTEEVWQSIKCTEGTRPVHPNSTDGNTETPVESTEAEPWGSTHPWGSDGAVWSPGSHREWGGSDEKTDLMKDAPGYDLEKQGQELESDTEPPVLFIVEEKDEEFEGYSGEEEDEQAREEDEDETESKHQSKIKDKGLFAVTFELPGWCSAQGQNETATKSKTETTGDVFKSSHRASDTTKTSSSADSKKLTCSLIPSLQQHDETPAPLNTEPTTDSMPLWSLEQSSYCNTLGSTDGNSERRSDCTHGVTRFGTFRPRDVANVVHYPAPLHSLKLLEAKLPDRNTANEGTFIGKEKHQHCKITSQDDQSQEKASHASLPLIAIQLSTASSSLREPPSPILPGSHKSALAVEELAEKLLPIVVDKNGYIFECILKDGIEIIKMRAYDRFGLRDRRRLSPSGLRKAWTLKKGTSNDAAEDIGK